MKKERPKPGFVAFFSSTGRRYFQRFSQKRFGRSTSCGHLPTGMMFRGPTRETERCTPLVYCNCLILQRLVTTWAGKRRTEIQSEKQVGIASPTVPVCNIGRSWNQKQVGFEYLSICCCDQTHYSGNSSSLALSRESGINRPILRGPRAATLELLDLSWKSDPVGNLALYRNVPGRCPHATDLTGLVHADPMAVESTFLLRGGTRVVRGHITRAAAGVGTGFSETVSDELT